MHEIFDTIFAPITGSQKAAVCVIRISGPDSINIASKCFHPWPKNLKFRHSYYGNFVHIDDGLMVAFEQDSSFTGELSIELHIHGSLASLRGLSDSLLSNGARPAQPGEFTHRALMNGRIDLSQAEGIADTIDARTLMQLQNAGRLRSGELRKFCTELRDSLLTALAHIEAHVDFSEELGELNRPNLGIAIEKAQSDLRPYLIQASKSQELREGILVAIVGSPNSGKSSLLNRLSQSDRAIVTPIPGTTRDTLEVTIELEGILFRLIDTAGIRDTQEQIELLGIERARIAIEDSHIVILVYDCSTGFGKDQAEIQNKVGTAKPLIIIANKSDIAASSNGIPISCLRNTGIESLQKALVLASNLESGNETLIANQRQLIHLQECDQFLDSAIAALKTEVPDDLISTYLRAAEHSLGQVSGQTSSPDMVDEIFSRFCLGK